MTYVRVKQKYQVTIPLNIREKLMLHEGDSLEIKEKDGNVILIPQDVIDRKRNKENKKPSLLSMIGANKDSGLYESAKDIDNYINNLRDEWN